MASFGIIAQPASPGRRIVFWIVGGLVALALLAATPNALAPWTAVNVEGLTDPAQARWSLALEGTVDALLVACLIAALVRPAGSALLAQYVLYAAVLAALVVTPFTGPTFLITVGMLLLVVLTYPHPRELFSLRSQQGPAVGLLAVAVVAAGVLVPLAAHAVSAQIGLPGGSGPDFNVLATNAEHLLLLALAGLLAATRRPGWTVIAVAVTVAYAYLGIASIVLPNQANSWGVSGGLVSLLWAVVFGAAAMVANRSPRA